jgi:hypothetical protein
MAENTSACSASTAPLSREQEGEVERLTRERNEARAYLKAFVAACIGPSEPTAVGVHEANPTAVWCFTLVEEDHLGEDERRILGGQVRRAMEIVGFDKLGIEPASRTIAQELAEAAGLRRKVTSLESELASLRAQQPTADIGEAVRHGIASQGLSEVEPGQFWNDGHGLVLNAGVIARSVLAALSASTGSPGHAAQPGAGVRELLIEAQQNAKGVEKYSDDEGSRVASGNVVRLIDAALAPLSNGGESATAARETGEWQPISMAPLDGTEVWLGDVTHVVTGWWDIPDQCWTDYNGPVDGEPSPVEGSFKPTHWQPFVVPEPPPLPAVKPETASVGGRDAE